MGVFIAAGVTTAFRVKDDEAFGELVATIPFVDVTRKVTDQGVYWTLSTQEHQDGGESGDWPAERTDDDGEYLAPLDIPAEVFPHLIDNEVVIFFSVGVESRWHMSGTALAFNNQGFVASLSLADIYPRIKRAQPDAVFTEVSH